MTILSLMAKEKSQEKGEMLKLIRLVSKRVQKGYDAAYIAELFEKTPTLIETLCTIVNENPGMDEYDWYDIFTGNQKDVA